MATAEETLRAVLSETEYGALMALAESTEPPSGRSLAAVLGVSPTTANKALAALSTAGFATSVKRGRANLWRLAVSNPSISAWLEEVAPTASPGASVGSSPYSTGGGGVRLEHSYAACLIAGFLAGESLSELGDALSVDSIRLQASDVSEVDDILINGRDAHGEIHRSSIAVRRNPALVTSDSASVPLFRDFLAIVTNNWPEVSAGRWRLVLAVNTNANAVAELADLAELAATLPSGADLANRLTQAGRTNAGVRDRYGHIKGLVEQATEGLPSARDVGVEELTWRVLAHLSTRTLRLERTDRTDRTTAVNALQRALRNGTSAAADSLFSRIEELAGRWGPQGAVLTQAVIRRSLGDYPLSRSARFANAWSVIDRLGERVRDSIRPELRADTQALELERAAERSRLMESVRSVGESAGALVVVGDPDVGKSALSLRVVEALQAEGAAVASLSLRDLPHRIAELEGQLGGSAIDDVMAAGEVGPIRVLLVDGAESVLEGKGQIFRTVARAALEAGFGVVAVTRTDGSRPVRDELASSCELAGSAAPPAEHVVGPLTEDEREALTTTFTSLARLRDEPRTGWLLGRPGLVDVLLRTGEVVEPADLLCEADVFRAVWRSLIRCNEVHPAGTASPDDREQAALDVARRTLDLVAQPPHGTAAAELRSDGVLRVPNDPALSPGDEFATDLFRDFALCRLFIVDGWHPLSLAGAPRWSIRAARLGCQAALATTDLTAAWAVLMTKFSEIAEELGQRWVEVPYEAILTLGDAEAAIRELWSVLSAEDSVGLKTLLRLAQSRYVHGTIGDPFSLAPVVKVAFCDGLPVDRAAFLGHRRLREVVQDLVLAWLRGMATSPQEDQLRQKVRDVILDSDPPLYDDFAVEALALLGPDLDARAEKWLRKVAAERPGQLNDAVESFSVAVSLSAANPGLLLDLAEAYYIEKPDPSNRWGGGHLLDDGIRDFKHGLGLGWGSPAAAWYYGPFFRLLNTIPSEAIAFINRMLNHAARFRVEEGARYGDEAGEPGNLAGVELDLPAVGPRLLVGDSHVWAWYRGTSVGPYACMSALLALERFIDHLLENLKIPARSIVELLVRDCHNLAVPGLLVGFLTRHPEARGDLLDPFLVSPTIWHLETARVTGDYGFRVRDPDADTLAGADRRRHTFQETVGAMVVNARLTGDEDRLDQLMAVGAKLIETARAELATIQDGSEDYLAVIESWAAMFQIENYRARDDGDQVFIDFERPEQIEQVLAPRNAQLQTTNLIYSLQNRYGQHNDSPEEWPVESLGEDLATARRIDEGEDVPGGILWPENGLVSVAAAAGWAHAMGLATLDAADLIWAVEAVLWAAENPQIDGMSYHGTMFAMGADRAAAASVPLLLLAPFDNFGLDQSRMEQCLRSLATSLFDEVRAIYVRGCGPVWGAPCDIDQDTGRCLRHRPAWEAASAGLIDCRLGPWKRDTQRREPDPLPLPFHESLSAAADDLLLVNRLRMPLACLVDARHVPCLQNDVRDLWEPLWDAHRRGLLVWWKEGYDHHSHITHEPIARRMIEIALDGDREPVRSHIEAFATNSNALHLLFDGFATVFSYDEKLRRAMVDFWPWALEVALDAVGGGTDLRSQRHWFDYMTAALLPTPNVRSWDSDIDGTLARCRETWLQPEALDGLADRWLRLSRWEPKAVDAVVQFAKGAPLQWQTTVALSWIETIIDGRYDRIANHLWFIEDWLTELRNLGVIVGDVKRRYHRIIDGLAAAGDRAAVRLQQLDE